MAEIVWESPKKNYAVRRHPVLQEVRMDGEFEVYLGQPKFESGYERKVSAVRVAENLTAQEHDFHFDVVEL